MAKVVVVDENDKVIGAVKKIEAVKKGLIRRISRVILYDESGRFLMQQRGKKKKSNPLKWDFSAVGHVNEGENYEEAAYRELKEELGLGGIKLTQIDYFFIGDEPMVRSGVKLPKFNTVYVGKYNGDKIQPSEREVETVKWMTLEEIGKMHVKSPEKFTAAFEKSFKRLADKLSELK